MVKSGMDESSLEKFSFKLRNRKFDDETCFLCAGSLTALGASAEHIIPRWAQKRFDLWNQKMVLLNGTSIFYKYLTVPCCEECNKYRLQPIETSIADAVSKGPDDVRLLGDRILFLWLGKIFYGILYKELFLSSDLRDINAPPIIDPDTIRIYEDHLFFLQEARGKIETVDFCPGSIFVFKTQKPENNRLQWDFTDNVDTLFIAIRMGDVGIIGVLNDGGILKLHGDMYNELANHPLHPLQFRELCAAISYQSSIRQRTPKYITIESNPHKVFQPPLGGFSLKPFYEDWDFDRYARFLAYYTGMTLEEIHPHPNQIRTYLYYPDGKPIYIPYENEETI